MSVAVKTPPEASAVDPSRLSPLYRFTVSQYRRMIEEGVLTGEDRVELLEGWIIEKMVHNPPHDGTVTRVNRYLSRVLPEEWILRNQCAIALPASQPEPDLAVVQGPEEIYFERHPLPRDIALVVEVADTTLLQDRQYKGWIYAHSRLPVYWIINLIEAKVEVYTHPKGGKRAAYRERRDYTKEESVPLVLAGRELAQIAARKLLP
jgi:hypothetical protein